MAPLNSVVRFQIDGEPYELDTKSLTLGEVEDIENFLQTPIQLIEESGKATLFLAYIAVRRAKPDVTLDQLRLIPLLEVQAPPKPRTRSTGTAKQTQAKSKSTGKKGAT